MSGQTQAALQDTVASYLAGDVAREDVEAAALAHLDGEPGYGELRDAYESLRDDPAADPGEEQAAAERLTAWRMASRAAQGRPLTTTI